MGIYSRALRHIDMNRVKELREEKIKKEKIVAKIREEIREELRNINSPEFSNWRCELEEGMTSSGMFQTTLPATGDQVIATQLGETISGNSPEGFYGIGSANPYAIPSNVDTMVFTVSTVGVGQLELVTTNSMYGPFGAGTHTVALRPEDINSNSIFVWFVSNGTETSGFGTWVINSFIRFQRRTPITVFVPLDSPEATSFIRTDPIMANLSPEERKKKLQDMLDASDEYIEKIFGEAFPGTGLDPAVGEAGDTPGVEIAGGKTLYGDVDRGLKPDGTLGAPKPGELNKGNDGKWYEYSPSGEWLPIPTVQSPKNNKLPPNVHPIYATQVAHYEPQGNLITEKKKLKSPEEVLNKIPGYYDGKPSPLGFPMEQPPKMKNGMHPDLVDGKRVADRFNRLDPQSAKAMPLTGNPHIDKKVKAARKKPK